MVQVLRAQRALLLCIAFLAFSAVPAAAAPGWVTLGTGYPGGPVGFADDGDAVGMYGDGYDFASVDRPAGVGNLFAGSSKRNIGVFDDGLMGFMVEPDGDSIAIIRETAGSLTEYRRAPGGEWVAGEQLAPSEVNYGNSERTLFRGLPDGRAILAWVSRADNVSSLNVRLRAASGTWSSTEVLQTSDPALFSVAPALGEDGTATVVWAQDGRRGSSPNESQQSDIWQATRLPGGGSFSAPQRVSAEDEGNYSKPQVGVDDQGRALIVWYGQGPMYPSCNRLRYATRAADSTQFAAPGSVFPGSSSTGDAYCESPDFFNISAYGFAMEPGGAAAVWVDFYQYGGGEYPLRVATKTPGESWSSAEPVGSGPPYSTPRLVAAPDGSFALTWWNGNTQQTNGSLRRPGADWEPLAMLSPHFSPTPSFDRRSHLVLGTSNNSGTGGWRAWDDTGPRVTDLATPAGEVGQEITFGFDATDDYSTIDGAATEWSFSKAGEDTRTAAGASPKQTFPVAGQWTVTAIVKDSLGNATTRTGTVNVRAANVAPTASFTATPSSVQAGAPVSFDGTASGDSDGDPLTFAWDFDGDGTADRTSGDSLVEITYSTAGTKTARLTVTDGRGGSAWTERSVTVTAPPAPTPQPEPRPAPEQTPVEPAPETPQSDEPLASAPTREQQAAGIVGAARARGQELTVPSFTIVSSRRERKVDNVVGMHVDRARDLLGKAHYIDLELEWTRKAPRKGDPDLGEVIAQTPTAGTVTDSGAADLLKVVLDVYAGPKGSKAEPCPDGFEKAVRKKDFDLGRELIDESCTKKAKVDDLNFKLVKGGQEMTIRNGVARRGGKEIDLNVEVPRDPRQHDLFMIFREQPRSSTTNTFDEDWRLRGRAGRFTCFQVQVFDRSKSFVQNATVRVEGSDVRSKFSVGEDESGTTDAVGNVGNLCTKLPGNGKIDVVAYATGTNGESVFGATQVNVTTAPNYRTPSGREFGRPAFRASVSQFNLDWISGAVSNLANFAGGQIATASATVQGALGSSYKALGDVLRAGRRNLVEWGRAWTKAWQESKLQPGNIAPGGTLGSGADPMKVEKGKATVTGPCALSPSEVGRQVWESTRNHVDSSFSYVAISRIIECGGGTISPQDVRALMYEGSRRRSPSEIANVIATGGLNVISTGGGNVISTGGGNVISTGGGNITSVVAGVISTGGGNVISTGGGNVISTGGGNFSLADLNRVAGVISTGGGNFKNELMAGVIATGGLNLTPEQISGVISTGGGNFDLARVTGLIGQAGGNLIGQAGGNFTGNNATMIANGASSNGGSVISVGGGNVISTGGGNVISTGGGNVISVGGGNFRTGGVGFRTGGVSKRPLGRASQSAPTSNSGYMTVAPDAQVLVCPKQGCLAFSKPNTSIFGSGEGIAPSEVKDARRSAVVAAGDNFALVPVK